MQKKQYSEAFREQAVRKVLERGERTVQSVADELGVGLLTLRSWVRDTRRKARLATGEGSTRSEIATASRRLELLLASAGMSAEELPAWCRQQGIYAHQLSEWKATFAQEAADGVKPLKAERDALRTQCSGLKKQLQQRDRALAEAASLLVLSKKFQALLAEADESPFSSAGKCSNGLVKQCILAHGVGVPAKSWDCRFAACSAGNAVQQTTKLFGQTLVRSACSDLPMR